MGYRDIILKSDQESALGKVFRRAKAHWGEGIQTMLAQSPVGDSQSSGFIERAIQAIESQIRTLNVALEERIRRKVDAGACIIRRLIEHAGNILT